MLKSNYLIGILFVGYFYSFFSPNLYLHKCPQSTITCFIFITIVNNFCCKHHIRWLVVSVPVNNTTTRFRRMRATPSQSEGRLQKKQQLTIQVEVNKNSSATVPEWPTVHNSYELKFFFTHEETPETHNKNQNNQPALCSVWSQCRITPQFLYHTGPARPLFFRQTVYK